MKLFIAACLFTVSLAAKLDGTYLPPSSAQSAGGNGNFLNAPSTSNFRSSASSYSGAASNQAGSYSSANNIGILRYNAENPGDGNYHYEYETENKIRHQESGQLRNAGSENEANYVTGSYSYTGPDGVVYTVDYVADENGFRASGAHLPTPPPIPEAILKSLQQNGGNSGSQQYNDHSNNGGYKY